MTKLFSNISRIKLPSEIKPMLIVVIDTEEEFNWTAPADRNEVGVYAMQFIDRVQDIFDQYGITPCYVIDYPVVSQASGSERLVEICKTGRCEIGTHLHPWVTPPYDEELTPSNTYAGNLPAELEYQKLKVMTNSIEERFGQRPVSYKAGRYGLGVNSESILEKLGYSIDLSVCPPVDYSADGGPDYSHYNAEPFWFGQNNTKLEIPITGAFVGWAGQAQRSLFQLANQFKVLKLPAIFSRLSVVDRLMLSPEGFDTREHIKITDFLLAQGVRTFTWSFHSTSVEPGMTPYVKTETDLSNFLDSFRRYFDYFFNQLGGVSTTPTQLKSTLETYK